MDKFEKSKSDKRKAELNNKRKDLLDLLDKTDDINESMKIIEEIIKISDSLDLKDFNLDRKNNEEEIKDVDNQGDER